MYRLNVSENQAKIMIKALEFYSRCKAGQITELYYTCGSKDSDREEFETVAKTMKHSLWPDMPYNSSKGVGQDYNDSDVAWDLYQVIRHRLAWDRGGNPNTVDYHTPLKYGSEKLASIKKNERLRNE